MSEIIFKQESYEIVGACFEVYNERGCGFLESVYHECLERELSSRAIAFQSQVNLELRYKGQPLKQKLIPDFVCFGSIVLEIKAVKQLVEEHQAQVHNYLKATGHKLGRLVNFGHFPKLEYQRIVR